MVGLRTTGVFPAALVALLLVSASRAADSTVNFDLYPNGAEDCLYKAADSSKCESDTVTLTNSCLCRNGGKFITSAAACIGRSSPDDLEKTYDVMQVSCKDSKTPISLTKGEFMKAASEDTSTSTSASSASTADPTSTTSTTASSTSTDPPATPSPTDIDNKDGEKRTGLSSGAMVGVIVGASLVGLALVGGAGWFLFRRRRKLGEESHPMLPQHGHASLVPESTAYNGSPPDTGGFPTKDWARQSGASGGFNWESPAHLAYPSGVPEAYKPGVGLAAAPIQELDSAVVHAPGTAAAPVEMGGTPVTMTATPHAQFQEMGATPIATGPSSYSQFQAYPGPPLPGSGLNPSR